MEPTTPPSLLQSLLAPRPTDDSSQPEGRLVEALEGGALTSRDLVAELERRDWEDMTSVDAMMRAMDRAHQRDAVAVPILIEALGLGGDVWGSAVAALHQVGEPAVAPLIAALGRPLPPIITFYAGPDWDAREPRYHAIEALSLLRDASVPRLLDALANDAPVLVQWAIVALTRIATHDRDPAWLNASIEPRVLGALASRAFEPAALVETNDAFSAAYDACNLLGRVGTARSLAALETLAAHDSELGTAASDAAAAIRARTATTPDPASS